MVPFLPVEFTTSSYEYVITGGRFLHAMGISIERVILGTLLNVALMVLTAYPLAKDDLPGLFAGIFPPVTGDQFIAAFCAGTGNGRDKNTVPAHAFL